mmetsp:Transcript_17004/g.23584  ORF Transcript_17004/g.23584 Transcript_17004/m.23584 type:complete len:599 (+) Transcript_17004:2-1798(+)
MDYFGPMVNRSARVMQAASGGQVLVSRPVWRAIQDASDKIGEIHSFTIGEIELKGLDKPELLTEILPVSLSHRSDEFTPVLSSDSADGSDALPELIASLQTQAQSLDKRLNQMNDRILSTKKSLSKIEPHLKKEPKDSDTSQKIHEVTGTQYDLVKKVDSIRSQNGTVLQNLDKLILQSEELRETSDEAYKEKGKIQRDLVILKDSYMNSSSRCSVLKNRIANYKERIKNAPTRETLQEELAFLANRLKEWDDAVAWLRESQISNQEKIDQTMLALSSDELQGSLKILIEQNKELEAHLVYLNDELVNAYGSIASRRNTLVQREEDDRTSGLEATYDVSNVEQLSELFAKIEEQKRILEELKLKAKKKKTLVRKLIKTEHPAYAVMQKLEKDRVKMDLMAEQKASENDDTGASEIGVEIAPQRSEGDFQKAIGLISYADAKSVIILAHDASTLERIGMVTVKDKSLSVNTRWTPAEVKKTPGLHVPALFSFEIEEIQDRKSRVISVGQFTYSFKSLEAGKYLSCSGEGVSMSLKKKPGDSGRIIAQKSPIEPSKWAMEKKKLMQEIFCEGESKGMKLRCGKRTAGSRRIVLSIEIAVE